MMTWIFFSFIILWLIIYRSSNRRGLIFFVLYFFFIFLKWSSRESMTTTIDDLKRYLADRHTDKHRCLSLIIMWIMVVIFFFALSNHTGHHCRLSSSSSMMNILKNWKKNFKFLSIFFSSFFVGDERIRKIFSLISLSLYSNLSFKCLHIQFQVVERKKKSEIRSRS